MIEKRDLSYEYYIFDGWIGCAECTVKHCNKNNLDAHVDTEESIVTKNETVASPLGEYALTTCIFMTEDYYEEKCEECEDGGYHKINEKCLLCEDMTYDEKVAWVVDREFMWAGKYEDDYLDRAKYLLATGSDLL